MNISSKLFNTQLPLNLVIIKSLGILSSIAFSIVAIKYFLKIGSSEGAVFLNILAALAFCSLVQLGMSKPAYAEILSLNFNDFFWHKSLNFYVRIFKLEYFLSLIIFTFLAYFLAFKASLDKKNLVEVLLFSLGATSIYAGVYQRDIAYECGKQLKYELFDLIRKITLLIFILLCYLNINFSIISVALMLFGMYLYNKFDDSLLTIKLNYYLVLREIKYKNQFLKNSKQNLIFSINELVIYNFPIIYYSLFPSTGGIIYFVIWNRFFNLITIPFKLLIDSCITDVARDLYQGNHKKAKNTLCRIFSYGFILLVISICLIYYLQKYIFNWIGTDINNNIFFFASLVTWGFFNLGQHCAGSLMSALHYGYRYLFWISTFSVVFISAGYIYLLSFEENIGKTIFIISFIYGALSLAYYSFFFVYFRKSKSYFR